MRSANSPHTIDPALLDECFRRSRDLLLRNATSDGILAASPGKRSESRNYTCIFGRDAAICALGMAVSGDTDLVQCARAGLETLGRHQAANGQIPKFVRPESGEADFWYTGCIDATLWWLIALRLLQEVETPCSVDAGSVERAVQWLLCQEHQGLHLLQQNEASDWADIMPRSGFVLYSNALWYWVKKLYSLPAARATRDNAAMLLSPFGNGIPDNRRLRVLIHYVRSRIRPTPFFLSFVNFSTWGEEGDVYGNILAALSGLADTSCAGKITDEIRLSGFNDPYPVRVVGTPLGNDSPLWRPYMERHRQNLPWCYHNGGIWPFVGSFLVLLLAKLGRKDEAWWRLHRIAEASRLNGWEFNEWLHGRTAEPLGMPGQSWNAAMYILAYQRLCNNVRCIS